MQADPGQVAVDAEVLAATEPELAAHAPLPVSDPLLILLGLIERARHAQTTAALGFLMVNETWQVAPYRQAFLFVPDALSRLRLTRISALTSVEADAPMTVWLEQLAAYLDQAPAEDALPRVWTAAELPPELAADWAEWLPPQGLACMLRSPQGEHLGLLLFAQEEHWETPVIHAFAHLVDAYAHAWWALTREKFNLAHLWQRFQARWQAEPRWKKRALAGALALCLFPVRLTALAPAEVVGLSASVVSAPMDGVVAEFHVHPSQAVQAGDALFSLDDTTLRNRLEVARKALTVARSDVLAATQKAFDNVQSKSELATLRGRVGEKEAEVAALEEQFGRITVRADHDGVVVFGDENDWLGKPVVTGERVAMLADPKDAGMMIWMPVADAIALDVGAPARLFLQVSPLFSLPGTVVQTSYQATLAPEGYAAYRLRARFDDAADAPRIGLRGTAKVSGNWAPLAYYLLRRPLGAVRQWSGW